MKSLNVVASVGTVLIGSIVQLASASSFQILEQSPAQLGKAFAGTASDAQDATTVFFNPAAMSQLEQNEVSGALNAIWTNSKFSDSGSNTNGVNGETDESALVPNLYGVSKVGDSWSIGYGVNAPFGLASSFQKNWYGRYLGTESELEVININVNSAFKLNDQWSFGLGINYQRAKVTLENQIDSTFGANPTPEFDSSVRIKGDDTDVVADLSVLWQPTDTLVLGLIWRQGGSFDLEGDAQFTLNEVCSSNPQCAGALAFLEGEVGASVDLPDTTTLSGSLSLNKHWAIHADIAQTAWSSIREVAITNTENGENLDTLELRYDDTIRVALGTTFAPGNGWLWRFGVALDEAPQTDPAYVSPRIPDENRTWLSAGFNYQWTDALSIDVAYTHILVDDAEINNVDGVQVVAGSFDSSVDILGVQLNWKY